MTITLSGKVIVIVVVTFIVVVVTKPSRERNQEIKQIQQELSYYRNNSSEWIIFNISESVAGDPKFEEYIKSLGDYKTNNFVLSDELKNKINTKLGRFVDHFG